MKKKTLYILLAILIPGGIILTWWFLKKKKKPPVKEQSPKEQNRKIEPTEANLDELFGDTDTFLENAEQNPKLWAKWYKKQIEAVKEYADKAKLPPELRKKWRQYAQSLYNRAVKNKDYSFWLNGWLEGAGDEPASKSIAEALLFQYATEAKENPDSSPFCMPQAHALAKAIGLDPADYNWLWNFPGTLPNKPCLPRGMK